MANRKHKFVFILAAVVALSLVGPFACMFVIHQSRRPRAYRIPFPAVELLTDEGAIELSKRAMILDGKYTTEMRPVARGHTDARGRETFISRNADGSVEILWWLGRPGYLWEYAVRVKRDGDDAVCSITKPL